MRTTSTRYQRRCLLMFLLAVGPQISAATAEDAPLMGWKSHASFPAPDAFQAAATDARFTYAITNTLVAKYDRQTGTRLALSKGDARHLNSGFLYKEKLYCAHSNYPQTPEHSEIKVLDPESMELTTFRDFGDYGGSLTWCFQRDGHWWCNFARYGDRNADTFLAKFDAEWKEVGRWTYPAAVISKLGRMSLSGGIWHDGRLLVTGHDDPVVFELKVPADGSVLEWSGNRSVPFTGQGFASDPRTGGLVGIDRAMRRVVFAEAVNSGPKTRPALLTIPADASACTQSRAHWAEFLNVPVEVKNSLNMKLVLIPPGRFVMGPNGSTWRVTLAKPYYLATTEVTLGAYRGFRPNHAIEGADAEFNADDRPAASLSWEDARGFCEWLSERPEEKSAGRTYVLPTEAQWEWAARAGTVTTRYFGDDDKRQQEHSWFNHTYTPNPQLESMGRGRQPVAKLVPNAFGLHDMLGNVWEWCEDRRMDAATGETRDPVMRGGSWRSGAFHCTAVAHDPGDPRMKGDNIGFRVLLKLGNE